MANYGLNERIERLVFEILKLCSWYNHVFVFDLVTEIAKALSC